jgi:hypothetical protein
MMSSIEITTEFIDPDGVPRIPEDTTIARFSIAVDADLLTANFPKGRSRRADPSESVFGPVAGVADWLIDNWMSVLWEVHTPFAKSGLGRPGERSPLPGLVDATRLWSDYLRDNRDEWEEPRGGWYPSGWGGEADEDDYRVVKKDRLPELSDWGHRHIVGHPTSNLALPSIVVVPEGRDVVLSVDRLPAELSPSVDFVGPDGEPRKPTLFTLSKEFFRAEARRFVERTIERAASFSEFSGWANWLSQRWHDAQEREADEHNRLRSMIGPLSANKVEWLRSAKRRATADGLEQLLLDCPLISSEQELKPVEDLVGAFTASKRSASGGTRWEALGQASVVMNQPDYEQGHILARIARKELHLGTKPIWQIRDVLDHLDVDLDNGRPTRLFRAAVYARRHSRARIVPSLTEDRMTSERASRFAVASALGRLLWASRSGGDEPICAAQGDHSMVSQSRRANAFAAEFLLPSEVIAGFGERAHQLTDVADFYGISRGAARWHAHNARNRLYGFDSY